MLKDNCCFCMSYRVYVGTALIRRSQLHKESQWGHILYSLLLTENIWCFIPVTDEGVLLKQSIACIKMNKIILFQGNLKHKSRQKDLCQLRWTVSGPWNLHISLNMSSKQLPMSFCISFDYLWWSILLEMQELLLAWEKHSCPETLPLSRNSLKAATITLFAV